MGCSNRPARAEATSLRVLRRPRRLLLVSTALQAAGLVVLIVPARAQLAPNAKPTGGQVVAGTASIAQSAGATTIMQSSQRAALNWKTFNVGSQQRVQFQQPSASASTLNRVTTPNPSEIAGRITANGQVVIVNQSGVVFDKGAQVDVNGLVVSAAGITNQNYMAGRMVFDQPARPNARIINAGTITIRQAGLSALVAPEVANHGVIAAKLGHVVLAGAKTATLDMYGDGLLSIDVTGEVTQRPVGPDGKPVTALVTNTGTILAEGGTVLLTGRAADGIVQNLVDAGGRIAAPTAGGHSGVVALQGLGGDIVVSGQVLAEGRHSGEHGGRIVVNSNRGVRLASTARLDASGRAGGGLVAVGATLRRAAKGPSVKSRVTANSVTIAPGASILADATDTGSGGRVTVLSLADTDFAGFIGARGGPNGGDGGALEVSGGSGFSFSGRTDLSAPRGKVGSLLLDPTDLDITNGSTASGLPPNLGTIIATGSTTAILPSASLTAIGASANVTVIASGSLSVQTNISVANGLLLQATTGDLTVLPNMTVIAGTDGSAGKLLQLSAGGTLLLDGAVLQAPSISLGGGFINLGSAVVNAGSAAGPLRLDSAGDVAQSGGTLLAGTLLGSITGDARLLSVSNSIAALGDISAGSLELSESVPLAISGSVTAGSASLGATSITEPTGVLNVSDLALASTGSITLRSASNQLATLTGISTGSGDATIVSATSMMLENEQRASFTVNGNALFEVAAPGGALSFVGGEVGGTLVVGGVLSLVADNISAPAGYAIMPGGMVEFAPYSPIGVSVGGTENASALVLSSTLLGDIQQPAIRIGGYSGGAGAISQTATAISFDGSVDLSRSTLDLQTAGTVMQTASFSAGTITGAVGALNLGSVTVGTLGSLRSAGDIALSDNGQLTIAAGSMVGQSAGSVALSASSIDLAGVLQGFQGIDIRTSGALLETGRVVLPTGTLTGSIAAGATLSGENTIAALGSFTSPTLLLNDPGSALRVVDAVNASSIALSGSSVTETGAGSLVGVSVLTANLTGRATLGNANSIATLGSFASDGLILADAEPLTLNGPVNAGSVAVIDAGSNGLSVLDTLVAGSVTLSAGSIEIGGVLYGTNAAGFVSLETGLGDVSENGTGVIETSGTLIGDIAGGVTLDGSNEIASLGSFSFATGFSLTDTGNLQIAGLVSGGSLITISDGVLNPQGQLVSGGTVAIPGTLSAGIINLNADSIDLRGVLHGISAVALNALSAAGGRVTEDGSGSIVLPLGTLSGGMNGDVVLDGGNTIGSLGDLSANSLTLQNGSSLRVEGYVNTAQSILLNTGTSDLIVDTFGYLEADNELSITARNISLFGGAGGSPVAIAASGSVAEGGTGSLYGELTGSVAGNAIFDGPYNRIGTLGSFSAGPTLYLSDNSTNLAIVGPVKAGLLIDINISAESEESATGSTLQASGIVNAASIALHAGSIDVTGTLQGTESINFSTVACGSEEYCSPYQSPMVVTEESPGKIQLASGTLTGDLNGIAGGGTALLLGTNTIGALGTFLADTFALDTVSGLHVTGLVTGANSATIDTSNSGDLTLEPSGTIAYGGNISLTANNMGLLGVVQGGSLVDLSATGSVVQGGVGQIQLASGTLTGTVGADARFDGPNAISVLGAFAARNLLLNDGANGLQIADAVRVGNLAINAGSVAEILSGSVIATGTMSGNIVGGATLESGGDSIAAIGSLTLGDGALVLADSSPLTIDGPLNATNSASITAAGINITGVLNAGHSDLVLNVPHGSIAESGTVIAGLLTGSVAGGDALLYGNAPASNQIGTLGSFAVAGAFALDDGTPLTVTGPVTAGTNSLVALKDDSVTVNGTLSAHLGTVEIAPATSLLALAVGTSIVGEAFISLGEPGNIDAGTLALGDSGTGNISLLNIGSIAPPTLVIRSAGSLTETGSFAVGTLTGFIAGTAAFTGTNAVAVLGDFTADGLVLDDASGLNVAGDVNGGKAVLIDTALNDLSVSAGAAVHAGSVDLRAGNLLLPGTVAGTTLVALDARTGSIVQTGLLDAGSLSGSAVGEASLTGANTVGALGNFVAAGFTLSDTAQLQVNGTISAGGITLDAASMMLTGALQGTTSIDLLTTAGDLSEAGTGQIVLTQGTLTGSVAGTATLDGPNTIGSLGNFSANGLVLDNERDLSIIGVANAHTSPLAISATGTLDLAQTGSVLGTSVDLTASDLLALRGLADGQTIRLATLNSGAAVTEAGVGTIEATTLTGSITGAATLDGPNLVRTLGDFAANGLTLRDGSDLDVAGNVNAGPSAAIDSGANALTVLSGGAVDAANVSLSAGSISLLGVVDGTNAANFLTRSGNLTEGGVTGGSIITAGPLTGSVAGRAELDGLNTIAVLGAFTAANGFALNVAGNLSAQGPVSTGPELAISVTGMLSVPGTLGAASIALQGGSIDLTGALKASTGINLVTTASNVTEDGRGRIQLSEGTLTGSIAGSGILDGTNTIAALGDLVANEGLVLDNSAGLRIAGDVSGGPNVAFDIAGPLSLDAGAILQGESIALTASALTENPAATVIASGQLSASIAASASLVGQNQIAALGNFTANGLTLENSRDLNITGNVFGGPSIVLTDSSAVTLSGLLSATDVSMDGAALSIPGSLLAYGTASLTAASGGIGETGGMTAGVLTGSAAGLASFSGNNRVARLAGFAAGGGLILGDSAGLQVTGPVQGGPTIQISDAGAIGVLGIMDAGSITLNAATIGISGSANAPGLLSLIATAGSISATGTLIAGALAGGTPFAASFTGSNAITTLSDFSAGSLLLLDETDLQATGKLAIATSLDVQTPGKITVQPGSEVSADTATLTASSMALNGLLATATSANLALGVGGLTETGTFSTGELDGTSSGPVLLTAGNQVRAIGTFSDSAGVFRLNTSGDVTLKGTLDSKLIVADVSNGQFGLADGSAIVTDGIARPPGAFEMPTQADGGAYLTSFTQSGTSRVYGLGGGPAILAITALGRGNITFDPSGGLYGPTTWLILTFGQQGTSGSLGTASGNVFVQSLDVQVFGTGGSANLGGTVGLFNGPIAAGKANIAPARNPAYRFNSCAIASVNCILLPTEGLPPPNPLQNLDISATSDDSGDQTVLLPIVSDRDFPSPDDTGEGTLEMPIVSGRDYPTGPSDVTPCPPPAHLASGAAEKQPSCHNEH